MLTLNRLLQIIAVSTRHLAPLFAFAVLRRLTLNRITSHRPPRLPLAVRSMLEDLGGAFIKYGQILAMRPDVIPAEYVAALSGLLDAVKPFPGDEAASLVERELGRPLTDVFSSFDRQEIAAASFGQVHKAVLRTGEAVAVKVLRPGLRRIADADIGLILFVARMVDFLGLMKRVQLVPLAEEFRDWTEEELDLRVEATYAQRLRDLTKDDLHSYIPNVYWSATTRQVMTTEYLDGIWISQILARIDLDGIEATKEAMAQRELDLDEVASNIVDNQLRQIFEHRLYHADPHAGNLVVLDGNVIGYVDFGITGELDSEFRATQLMLYDALERRDSAQYMRAIYRIMKPPPDNVDLDSFEREIRKNASAWRNALQNPTATLQERSSSWLFARNLKVTRKYGLEVSEVALRYYRALSVVELIVLRLSPKFDFVGALAIYLGHLQLRELAREIRLEAQARAMLANRRLLSDGLLVLRKMMNAGGFHDTVARRRVSRWCVSFAVLFRTFAFVAVAVAIALPLSLFWHPQAAIAALPMGIGHACLLLLVAAVISVWVAQRLYISSTR